MLFDVPKPSRLSIPCCPWTAEIFSPNFDRQRPGNLRHLARKAFCAQRRLTAGRPETRLGSYLRKETGTSGLGSSTTRRYAGQGWLQCRGPKCSWHAARVRRRTDSLDAEGDHSERGGRRGKRIAGDGCAGAQQLWLRRRRDRASGWAVGPNASRRRCAAGNCLSSA